MAYATHTEVSVDKSRAELERTLARYGASHFGYMSGPQGVMVQFTSNERTVRFALPLPDPQAKEFTKGKRGRWVNGEWTTQKSAAESAKLWEQACRQKWRALNLVVKAKLEAVEAQITTFEEEFLAHFVMPNGETFGQYALPRVAESLATGQMPPLLALQSSK